MIAVIPMQTSLIVPKGCPAAKNKIMNTNPSSPAMPVAVASVPIVVDEKLFVVIDANSQSKPGSEIDLPCFSFQRSQNRI
jgi:hypothetical protein